MPRSEVREIWALDSEFLKTGFSSSTTDDFGFCHVYYDDNDCCEAIEVFDDAEVYIDGKLIFPVPMDVVCKTFPDFETDDDGGISVEKAIGIYAPYGKAESIVIGKEGYYDY